ncbi:MAG: T9SS type A sorting domain-containing protein, partial [Saprospiraceae bacterium]|nr:T9SS type A sorting domain-containing protein [Saprospiraceae bacterium]
MHNVQGKDAEVERFFSYDTPLKGANFPVGIQLLIRDLLNLSGATAADPNIQLALQLLDGYSATQMLRQKAVIDANGNLSLSSAGFDAFQTELDALKAIRPLTAITRHIALANGCGLGIGQESVLSPIAMEFSLTLDGVPWGGVPYWQYDVRIEGTAYATTETATLLYERTTKVIPVIVAPIQLEESVSYTHPVVLEMDVAPGGNSNIGLAQLESALSAAFDNVQDQIAYSVDVALDHFCFVPTASSMGLPVTDDLFSPTSGGVASRSSVSEDNSVQSPFNQLPEYNQEHVSMNTRIADVLVDELMPHGTTAVLSAELSTGQIYNFGKAYDTGVSAGIVSTPRSISADLTVRSGAQLWINRKDRIAYTSDSGNPQNGRPQAFFVSVPGDLCGGSAQVVVTIEDGGKLLVGDNATAPENTAGMLFTSSSELHAAGSDPIRLENSSQLFFTPGTVLELQAGAALKARSHVQVAATDATFTMAENTKIEFEAKGIFDLNNTALDLPAGAEIALLQATRLSATGNSSIIHLRAGSTLRLSGESEAFIDETATLIIDPGANIILESPESQIRIEGRLVYNGDFNFSGQGYFSLAPTHTLEFGPAATRFHLYGSPIPYNRFLHLDDNTTLSLPNGIHLDLNRGAVEYTGTSSIRLGKGSDVQCQWVKFYGGGGAPCLFGPDQPGNITVSNCRFEDVEQPMAIYGGKGSNPFHPENSLTVNHTDFNRYAIGCDISARQGVGFTNCTFENTPGGGAPYAVFSDRNFFTLFRDCQIIGNATGAAPSSYAAADLLTDNSLLQGLRLQGGFLCWMDGGAISNCDIGIGNRSLGDPAHSPSNILLTNGATLDHCLAGISMEGDATKGLVQASCARFTWNHHGICGSDVTLLIDPTLMTANALFEPHPNTFIRAVTGGGNTSKYLSVCYSAKVPGSIPATRNFWGTGFGGGVSPAGNPTLGFDVRRNTGGPCTVFDPLVSVVWAPAEQAEPQDCLPEFACEGPEERCWTDCSLLTDVETSVRAQYQSATAQLLAESMGEAYARFVPVADLWQPALPEAYSDACRVLIQAARSFTEGEAGAFGYRQPASRPASDPIRIQPNPASGSVRVLLPASLCRVQLYNSMGIEVYATVATETLTIDVSSLPEGVYRVQVFDYAAQTRSSKPMLVLH